MEPQVIPELPSTGSVLSSIIMALLLYFALQWFKGKDRRLEDAPLPAQLESIRTQLAKIQTDLATLLERQTGLKEKVDEIEDELRGLIGSYHEHLRRYHGSRGTDSGGTRAVMP